MDLEIKRMKKVGKERKMAIELIKEYEKLRHLWDVNHEDYSKYYGRNEYYETLLQILRTYDPNGTVLHVKRKIANLRAKVKKEWIKVQESKMLNSLKYKPTLYYYKHMQFLFPLFEYSEDDSETEMVQQSKKQSITSYGQTIATQLLELDDNVRIEAEKHITDILNKARDGTLPAFSSQPVDILIIPESEPSWYDNPHLIDESE